MNSHIGKSRKLLSVGACILTLNLGLVGCMSTSPTMGSSTGNTVTGGAAGANAANNNTGLERCSAPLGTLSVFEDTSLPWWQDYRSRYPKLGSTIPVIRLMIQQSNCFVIVERGRAMDAMNRERQLMQSGQLRQGSNVGGGQMVAADYTISPEIQFSAQGTEGIKAIGGAILGSIGSIIGGGLSKNEAATTLLLIDNRSGVQVSASIGNAGNYDFNLFGGLFGGGAGVGASQFSKSPEGKVLSAAFADSYNQMVISLRNYKAQQVEGGLGKGGKLTVGGAGDQTPTANTNASIVENKPRPTVVHQVNVTQKNKVRRNRQHDFRIDEYDEKALNRYYDSLKQAAEMVSGLGAISAQGTNAQHKNMAQSAISMFASRLASSKIELEHWPLDVKQEAWRVLGKRITQYNKIFEQHRKAALENSAIDESFLSILRGINLITEASLFGS